tara:strand:- start:1287 stop:2423 length:1137 start_codon:yes stop_codon:yes gene_type:complete
MAKILIKKPDDSGGNYTTEITCGTFNFIDTTIAPDRSKKDPILAGIESFWSHFLSVKKLYSYSYGNNSFGPTFNHLVKVGSCPVLLSRSGIRYEINGKIANKADIVSALARLTYKSCFEDSPEKLLLTLYSTLNLPTDVKYCLENRIPYFFYDFTQGRNKIEVRLNCQQISDKEIAVEISDGIWGTMTVRELNTFCNFYLHGKKVGSWTNISPDELYYRLMDEEGSESSMKVMRAFLAQNRTQDIVEQRAIELVQELLRQYPDRLKATYDEDNQLSSLLVKGQDYDWKLTDTKFKSEIQMVSTYVWQPISKNDLDDMDWRGPICIDNMAKGSSLGDQFAARALALLNDSFTIQIVSTIRRYLVGNKNENRFDFDEIEM